MKHYLVHYNYQVYLHQIRFHIINQEKLYFLIYRPKIPDLISRLHDYLVILGMHFSQTLIV